MNLFSEHSSYKKPEYMDVVRFKNSKVSVTRHEDALIGHLDCNLERVAEYEEEWIAEIMESLGSWVTEQGGIVGHIKGFLESKPQAILFSLTREQVEKHPYQSTRFYFHMTAIVFAVNEARLRQKLKDIIIKLHGLEG